MMSYNEFKLCKGCPKKGARYFDTDGYWCCKHPEAAKHQYPFDPSDHLDCSEERLEWFRRQHEDRDPIEAPIPFVCMKTCPEGHWVRTPEGGQMPKNQTTLFLPEETP